MKQHPDISVKALFLFVLGMASYGRGDYQKAETNYQEALQLIDETGEILLKAWVWASQARLTIAQDRLSQAEALLKNSLDLSKRIGDRVIVAMTLVTVAELATARGYPHQAVAVLRFVIDHKGTLQPFRDRAYSLLESIQAQPLNLTGIGQEEEDLVGTDQAVNRALTYLGLESVAKTTEDSH